MSATDDLTPYAVRSLLRTMMAYTLGLEELLVKKRVLKEDELKLILPAWHVQADVIMEKLLAAERAEVTTDGNEERSTAAPGGQRKGNGSGSGDPGDNVGT